MWKQFIGTSSEEEEPELGDPAPPVSQVMAQSHLRFEDELLGSM